MDNKDDIVAKHKEKIRRFAEELALDLVKTEPNLIKRFVSFDEEVLKLVREVGNDTMQIIGSILEEEIKKKPQKKG